MCSTPKQRRLSEFYSPSTSKDIVRSPIFSSLPTTPRSNRKRSFQVHVKGQMTLDAGQKKIGSQCCHECGMVFSIDVPEDVSAHKAFHARTLDDVPPIIVPRSVFNSWKAKNWWVEVSSELLVFRVRRQLKGPLLTRFENIVKDYVNPAVGYSASLPIWNTESSRDGWLAVKTLNGRHVCVGVVLTEDARNIFRQNGQTEEVLKVTMGVNRIWTHPSARGTAIAKTCLDIARKQFLHPALPRHEVAFCEPTLQGKKFAKSYTSLDGDDVLVYNLIK